MWGLAGVHEPRSACSSPWFVCFLCSAPAAAPCTQLPGVGTAVYFDCSSGVHECSLASTKTNMHVHAPQHTAVHWCKTIRDARSVTVCPWRGWRGLWVTWMAGQDPWSISFYHTSGRETRWLLFRCRYLLQCWLVERTGFGAIAISY
jgi:hypothetical protein